MDRTSKIAIYLDPPTHHFLNNRLFDVRQMEFVGDEILAPYVYLKQYFENIGIPVRTADLMPETIDDTMNLYFSFGILSNYRKLARRPDTVLSACFAMEPPVVEPEMYRRLRDAQHYFRRVYSWSSGPSLERFVGGALRCQSFSLPQSFDEVHEDLWCNTDRKFMVMIASNKLPRDYWQELYTERKRAVEYFSYFDEVDLYGKGWDGPSVRVGKTWLPYALLSTKFGIQKQLDRLRPQPLLKAARKAYRGVAHSKSTTLSRYNFALCFENSILEGYISEKIFDCFFAGTIPVYLGAPEISEYVPDNCFIDMRHFPSYKKLRLYLKSLSVEDMQTYRENAKTYLRSSQFHRFSKAAFAKLFSRILVEDSRS